MDGSEQTVSPVSEHFNYQLLQIPACCSFFNINIRLSSDMTGAQFNSKHICPAAVSSSQSAHPSANKRGQFPLNVDL